MITPTFALGYVIGLFFGVSMIAGMAWYLYGPD